ncbi:MAG: efflux RND transporter permease subunit [Arenicella sp.]
MNTHTIFEQIIQFRWRVLALGMLVFVGMAMNAPSLKKDTSANAFIDPQDPALLSREKVKEVFGLSDPIVVAVFSENTQGIFNQNTLKTVGWVSTQIANIANIDPARVTSLATESNIKGTFDGMDVEDFYAQSPNTPERAEWIKHAINDFPLYQGTLVSRDGKMTLIVAELIDEMNATHTYDDVIAMVKNAPLSAGDEIHVAGEGAVAGYLSTYIDNDAKKLNPLAGVIITLILFLAFRTLKVVILPNIIVIFTVGSTLGTMALFGIDFYVITNGLLVTMIGIAVADSIHIFSQYYEEIAADPTATGKQVTARALSKMWRPITLTTLTTMAGFGGLAITTTMPPVFYFGIFGAYAVFMAWLFSLTILPAILSMLPPKPSKLFRKDAHESGHGKLSSIGSFILWRPKSMVMVGVVLAIYGGFAATGVEVNDERISNFKSTERISIADRTMNASMDGTYYLDVKVETTEVEGLFQPTVLRKIEALQTYAETLPGVGGTTSIADYIKQMHKAVNENQEDFYTIPDDPLLIAQLFFLYFSSGEPTDFEEEIDGERKLALVRINLPSSLFSSNKIIVEQMQAYIDEHVNSPEVSASLSGRVNVDYYWIKGIADSNLLSILVSLAAVIAMAAILFKSLLAAFFAIVPVGLSVLLVYAVMGVNGIWLGVGTSMFASIAIGLGVDFAIHTIDRMRELISHGKGPWRDRIVLLYPTTGRALMFNFIAISLGFGVLMTSDVPPLINFGMLVSIAVSTTFIVSLVVLPALAILFKPKFLERSI